MIILKILHTIFHFLFTAIVLLSFLVIGPMHLIVRGWIIATDWISLQDERAYYKLRPELEVTEQDIKIFRLFS